MLNRWRFAGERAAWRHERRFYRESDREALSSSRVDLDPSSSCLGAFPEAMPPCRADGSASRRSASDREATERFAAALEPAMQHVQYGSVLGLAEHRHSRCRFPGHGFGS